MQARGNEKRVVVIVESKLSLPKSEGKKRKEEKEAYFRMAALGIRRSFHGVDKL